MKADVQNFAVLNVKSKLFLSEKLY